MSSEAPKTQEVFSDERIKEILEAHRKRLEDLAIPAEYIGNRDNVYPALIPDVDTDDFETERLKIRYASNTMEEMTGIVLMEYEDRDRILEERERRDHEKGRLESDLSSAGIQSLRRELEDQLMKFEDNQGGIAQEGDLMQQRTLTFHGTSDEGYSVQIKTERRATSSKPIISLNSAEHSDDLSTEQSLIFMQNGQEIKGLNQGEKTKVLRNILTSHAVLIEPILQREESLN